MAIDREKIEGQSMPRLSWNYESCTLPDHWFLTALAYQESSHHLFSEMIEQRLHDSFHHAKVAASLLEHAVELFLKAGIAQAGKDVPTHHQLDQLHAQFKNLYHGKKFAFTASIEEMLNPPQTTPTNVFARYPTDQSGQPWAGNTHIDLAIWFSQACKFLDDFKRLEPLMKERYPATRLTAPRCP
jgi:hypothetical protein